jgi:aconitate hydratase
MVLALRNALRAPQLSRALATASATPIGATKVAMSIFEQDKFINYQRIEDNLVTVRAR